MKRFHDITETFTDVKNLGGIATAPLLAGMYAPLDLGLFYPEGLV